MAVRHAEGSYEKKYPHFIVLVDKGLSNDDVGVQEVPRSGRYGRELVSKPAISSKKSLRGGGYRRTPGKCIPMTQRMFYSSTKNSDVAKKNKGRQKKSVEFRLESAIQKVKKKCLLNFLPPS